MVLWSLISLSYNMANEQAMRDLLLQSATVSNCIGVDPFTNRFS